MKWLYKLEYKYRKYSIENLMMVVVLGQAMVYFANMFAPAAQIASRLALSWNYILQGEVWRIITFIFVPSTASSPIFLAIALYFYYFIGSTLERNWGAFKFNIYYLLGIVGALIAGLIYYIIFPGGYYYITTEQLHLSLFFAFAMLYPNMQIMLFFVVPVKIKYLGFLSAALMAFQFIMSSWATRLAIIMSLINFFIFFGGTFIRHIKQYFKHSKSRRDWRNNNRH